MRNTLPLRFRLRTILVFVAVCAAALVYVRQKIALDAAERNYQVMFSRREAFAISLADVVSAADNLYTVKLSTIWIRRNEAFQAHVAELKELLKHEEGRIPFTLYSDGGHEEAIAACDQLRRKIESLEKVGT